MRVYIVLSEKGTILAVYKNKSKAQSVAERLGNLYERATVKECTVI